MFTVYFTVFVCSLSYAQDKVDYTLARVGDYVSGVYVFFYATPIHEYEYVGRIKPFKPFGRALEKQLHKRIKKARRKYADFDALLFKRNFKFVEVVKFKDRVGGIASFKLGDRATYTKKELTGKVIYREVEIVGLRNSSEVAVRYIDTDGNEKHEFVNVRHLSKLNQPSNNVAPSQNSTE